ncbi:penicillin-binding protein [candidate division WWE3 bacterium]|uniref:Penicillin-binding protein n=1 Tax=candidate division WWE3 bacterium TaxID=2053526 RepID=A0A955J1Z5_UNCKA|nr:penicillin-binding protein [candidate division WWE3 bacterium]
MLKAKISNGIADLKGKASDIKDIAYMAYTKRTNKSRRASYTRRTIRKSSGDTSSATFEKNKKLIVLTYLATFVLIGEILGFILIMGIFVFFARDLPNPNQLLIREQELSSKILDRNGKSIYEVFGEKNRVLITVDQVAPALKHATLATEDSSFYLHSGVDYLGMLRAVKNTILGQGLQGGSTITQQVVKNALLTQDRTITRKIKEFILSQQLEATYTKDEIIQMYLNETPYGGQNYGALTASKAYFDKLPSELTIAEAAYMAGLPQSPSRYSYFSSDPTAGLERKNYVLYLMNERGWIDSDGKRHYLSDEEYETALKEELQFKRGATSFEAPHFVFFVKEQLAERFGEEFVEQAGLEVTTTLDIEAQNLAQQIVSEELDGMYRYTVGNGALVATDPRTGQIIAMVGSKDYFGESYPEGCTSGITGENSCIFEPNLNVAVARRQPGSSIKPITYITMLEQGYPASYPFLDVPTTFKGEDTNYEDYNPKNYDGRYRGVISLRKSLANSLNIPAVKAVKIVGIDSMLDTAQRLGLTTFEDRSRLGLSVTLGGAETKLLEMTNAFGTFGNAGLYHKPTSILEVKDAHGNVIYKWQDDGGKRAVSAEAAYIMSDILSDDGARSDVFGFGSLLNIPGHDVAVKTGTTDDKRDNYAVGYTKDIATGVWIGNNNNEAMSPFVESGVSGATPIWHRFMKEYLALKELPRDDFVAPEGVHKITIDELTGALPYRDRPTRDEWFIKGNEPTAPSPWYQHLEICKKDGLIANDSCKKADETDVKTFIKVTAERSEWQDDVDFWVGEHYKDDDSYFPPTAISGLEFDDKGSVKKNTEPKVSFTGLSDGDEVPLDFRLNVEVSSPNDINEVRIYRDGDKVTEDGSAPYGYNFNFEFSQIGTHEFSAIAEDEDGREGRKTIKLKVVGD